MSKFEATLITDAKRLARGEQYIAARTLLRARSIKRNNVRILMIPGEDAAEEINVIRELWKGQERAEIVAVNMDEQLVHRAVSEGADAGFSCDVRGERVREAVQYVGNNWKWKHQLHPALMTRTFDLAMLDLCQTVDLPLKYGLRAIAAKCVRIGGVVVLAFSYGRDVAEHFISLARMGDVFGSPKQYSLVDQGVPESVVGRLMFLGYNPNKRKPYVLRRVLLYRGNESPMCSTLWQVGGGDNQPPTLLKLGNDDYEDAIFNSDPRRLYACADERYEQMRRSRAARKAHATRRENLHSAEEK